MNCRRKWRGVTGGWLGEDGGTDREREKYRGRQGDTGREKGEAMPAGGRAVGGEGGGGEGGEGRRRAAAAAWSGRAGEQWLKAGAGEEVTGVGMLGLYYHSPTHCCLTECVRRRAPQRSI